MLLPEFDENGKIKHKGELFTAIKELDSKLDELGIPHEMREHFDGYQICVPAHLERRWEGDAIQTSVSYGAEQNLIEVWGFNLHEPEGFLTADEALEYFITWHEKEKRSNKNEA